MDTESANQEHLAGNNAGHTIVNDRGEFKLHLVPAGIFYPEKTCVIGNGVAIDPEVLLGPHGSVTLPVEWRRSIPVGGPGRIPPPQLGFVITVQLTDNAGHRVSETVTARESLPRPWQVF